MFHRMSFVALACALAACSQPSAPSPSSPGPSAPPASAAPEQPGASPVGGALLGAPKRFTVYDFQGIGVLAQSPFTGDVFVADTHPHYKSPARYLLRKFSASGDYVQDLPLQGPDAVPPNGIDGLAFDRQGNVLFGERRDEAFRLIRLHGATPRLAEDLPLFQGQYVRRAQVASRNNGEILVAYESRAESDVNAQRNLSVAHTASNGDILTLVQMKSPLREMVSIRWSGDGDVLLLGNRSDGKLVVMTVNAKQETREYPVGLLEAPKAWGVDERNRLWLLGPGAGEAAAPYRVVALESGQVLAEGVLPGLTEEGAVLQQPTSLSFKGTRLLVAGQLRTSRGDLRPDVLSYELAP